MSLVATGQLSLFERDRLVELEAVIARGLQTFVEVGAALLEIRESRLYRETHASFGAYLEDRWQMSRQRGYQLIDAAEVSTVVDVASERQARELVPLLREAGDGRITEVVQRLEAEFPGERLPPERVERLLRYRLERRARESARAERTAAGTPVHDDVEVRHGDFRQALSDLDGQVDAIVTDPPYEREWIDRDAADFAAHAARMLKPTGTLAVMFGVLAQYELKVRLDEFLRYRWTGAYLMPGWTARNFAARLATGWKPILIYARTDAPAFEFLISDVFVSEAADKQHHRWGQSEGGTEQLVERFTLPGQLVVDPFLGGGTTAVVAARLGRRFVGCDKDAAAIHTARERMRA